MNTGMKVAILTERDAAEMIQRRAKSRDWWIICTDFTGADFICEVERSHYLGKPGLNSDFELSLWIPLTFVYARKRHMKPKQFARILRKYGAPLTAADLREQDIICCGGDIALTLGWARLQRWLAMPVAAAEPARF